MITAAAQGSRNVGFPDTEKRYNLQLHTFNITPLSSILVWFVGVLFCSFVASWFISHLITSIQKLDRRAKINQFEVSKNPEIPKYISWKNGCANRSIIAYECCPEDSLQGAGPKYALRFSETARPFASGECVLLLKNNGKCWSFISVEMSYSLQGGSDLVIRHMQITRGTINQKGKYNIYVEFNALFNLNTIC